MGSFRHTIKEFIEALLVVGYAAAVVLGVYSPIEGSGVRIKDVAQLNGIRENMIQGYGLVIGLSGTGDSNSADFTFQSISNMLMRMGIQTSPDNIKVQNVAAVIVTAKVPAFTKEGTRFDVSVSSIGDADSLFGGTLLMTPLKGPDGEVYAVAQGPISTGGLGITAGGASQKKNHLTVASITNGAVLEREIPIDFIDKGKIYYTLYHSDFTTASRLASTVNKVFPRSALPLDSATVEIKPPVEYMASELIVFFISQLENLTIEPDATAKIVMNEKTGTIVAGENVRISKVAISHGSLTITVKTQTEVSQPEPFSKGGDTVVVKTPETNIKEEEAHLIVVEPQGPSIGELAKALNSLGVLPRDMVAIFQAIKEAGGLYADIEIL